MPKMIKFADLFAGTGGIRLGFENALNSLSIDHKCVFSAEIDAQACKTYKLNFEEDPYCDITSCESIADHDVLLAGFPCQSFSYAGKRKGFGDTRGTLFFDVQRLLLKHKPKAFLLENVRGLTTHDEGRTFATIIHCLEDIGYGVDYLLLNSSNFGVPQNRVRIYILGILGRKPKLTLSSNVGPADTHKFSSYLSQTELFGSGISYKPRVVADILEKNPPPKYNCTKEFTEMLRSVVGGELNTLHGYRLIDYRNGNSIHSWELGVKGKCTPMEIEFMNLLIANRRKKIFGKHQDGKSLTRGQIETFYHRKDFDRVTASLIKKGYLSKDDGKYNPVCGNMSFEVFKFLDPNGISITLTASDTNRLGIVQNNIPRRITPRESARLQGYPDSYQLLEDDNAVYKQMGNGVSVPVVEAVILDLFSQNKNLIT